MSPKPCILPHPRSVGIWVWGIVAPVSSIHGGPGHDDSCIYIYTYMSFSIHGRSRWEQRNTLCNPFYERYKVALAQAAEECDIESAWNIACKLQPNYRKYCGPSDGERQVRSDAETIGRAETKVGLGASGRKNTCILQMSLCRPCIRPQGLGFRFTSPISQAEVHTRPPHSNSYDLMRLFPTNGTRSNVERILDLEAPHKWSTL